MDTTTKHLHKPHSHIFLLTQQTASQQPAEMPIASGAAGRVDVGVDTSIAWTPDGLKRKTKPANWNCDSYLQRYQELRERQNKTNLLQSRQNNTVPSDHGNDGPKEEFPQANGGGEDPASGEPSSGQRSKKSQLCVIL